MRVYSVTEFNREINLLLSDISVCVQGEVSNFKITQNRFVWFDLKDTQGYVSCFLLAFNLKQQLTDGMQIRVIGHPGLFTKSGRFHFAVQEIELVGEGSLKKEFELLKKKLEQEGLFNQERKRSLPRFPKNIGLITSQDGAAYTDILKVFKNRWPGLNIFLYPVAVQGQGAERDILNAFKYFQTHDLGIEVLILTRGGGSMEDLQVFNLESVSRAAYSAKIPVVTAVGHERDTTLVDYVADLRAATPSNAAELVVPHKTDVGFQIETYLQIGQKKLLQHVADKKQTLNNFQTVFGQKIFSFQEQVNHCLNLLQAYNPVQVLKRGYSITRSGGKIIRDAKQVKTGALIETQLAHGKITAKTI